MASKPKVTARRKPVKNPKMAPVLLKSFDPDDLMALLLARSSAHLEEIAAREITGHVRLSTGLPVDCRESPGSVSATPSGADATQIGGDHYKTMGDAQPWNVLQAWLTPEEYRGWQKGVVIAYLARERQKGGDVDIKKAMHHLQKLVEVTEGKSA